MVGLARFELATTGLGNRCSIHLSYSPAIHFVVYPRKSGFSRSSGSDSHLPSFRPLNGLFPAFKRISLLAGLVTNPVICTVLVLEQP